MNPPNEADWDRWHELRDIRAYREFTLAEYAEYLPLCRIVAKLDTEEEAIATPAVDALVEQHKRILASLERLTEAVEKAAKR